MDGRWKAVDHQMDIYFGARKEEATEEGHAAVVISWAEPTRHSWLFTCMLKADCSGKERGASAELLQLPFA